MATENRARRRIWPLTLAILLAGLGCTALLWYTTESLLRQVNRAQAATIHTAAERHLFRSLQTHEALAQTLTQALATADDPAQILEQIGKPLLQRFPELVALERYAAPGPGAGPQSWQQVQLIARGGISPNPDLRPFQVPHWRAVVALAWRDRVPGVTPLGQGSGVLLGAPSSRSSVHLFWPTPRPQEAMPEAAAAQLLGLMLAPEQLLTALPNQIPGAAISYRLFDLDSQSADPIARASNIGQNQATADAEASALTYESELTLVDRNWLLSTQFNFQVPAAARGFLQAILVFGVALTLLITLLCQRLLKQAQQREEVSNQAAKRWKSERLAGQNAAIEKNIMGRALMDSEQRTRDFIDLSNGFSCELDEDWRIGFISSQIAGILDRTPADLADQPLLMLLPEQDRGALTEALETCCRERQMVSIETVFLQPDGDKCPVILKITPVTDGINHCIGYRAVGWRR